MKESSDDTTGLLSALLKAHKDIKSIYYLGAAVLAVDLLLVIAGKGNFASLSLQSAGNVIGIVILALIGWALLQNMVVPIISSALVIIFSSWWGWIRNHLFPDTRPLFENPDDRLYVSAFQIKEDIICRPEPGRIARYEQEQKKGDEALIAARHVEYASAGLSSLVIASRLVPGTIVAEMSIWCWLILLVIALMPWLAWTFGDVLKPSWIVDPELAGRIRAERRARKKREEE